MIHGDVDVIVIVLQGEVEQISMMKPRSQNPHETGLLEYLEDIIGTDKYIPLIEEAAKRCACAVCPCRSSSHVAFRSLAYSA